MVFPAKETIPVPTKDILSWIFDEVPYDQHKPIYVDAAKPERTISAHQARKIIRQLVAGLRRWGVQPGQKHVVCLHAFNDIMFSMMFLGIIASGGIFAATNPAYTPYELEHHFRNSEARYIVTEPEMLGSILEAAKECNIPHSNILIFNVLGQAVPAGFQSWETLLDKGEEDWVRFDDLETARSTEAARMFSSGTTGLPKAAMLTHRNFVAHHTMVYATIGIGARREGIRRLLTFPMFHAAAAPVSHTTTLKLGHMGFVMRRFDLNQFLANIQNLRITDLGLAPPIVVATIMSPVSKKYDLSSVKFVQSGAAPLDKGPQKKFETLMGNDGTFTQVWGMTEATCVVTSLQYPEKDYTGSVGRPVANIDMKILDDDGNEITDCNVSGELCVRGPTVVPGYLNNPVGNQSFDSDGFYHTGDIGYCDAKSKLWYIIDRKKELIKVRGFQVAPTELEAVLLSHPQIVDAAVIGVQFGRDESQLPRAYVVRRSGPDGEKLTEHNVKNHTEEKLAKYKRLDGGVRFVGAIPRNASGKILKRILRDEAKKEMEAKL